jgi:hypothetical protein
MVAGILALLVSAALAAPTVIPVDQHDASSVTGRSVNPAPNDVHPSPVDYSQVFRPDSESVFDSFLAERTDVPEPVSLATLGLSIGVLALIRRKRRARK